MHNFILPGPVRRFYDCSVGRHTVGAHSIIALKYPVTQFKGALPSELPKGSIHYQINWAFQWFFRITPHSWQLDPSLQGSSSLGRAISVLEYPFGGASLYSMPLLPQGSPSFCFRDDQPSRPVHMNFVAFIGMAWTRVLITGGYTLIIRFCRMVGHHDFLVQSFTQTPWPDINSTYDGVAWKPSWTTNQQWHNPSFLALALMYIPIGVSTIFTTLREGSHDGFV